MDRKDNTELEEVQQKRIDQRKVIGRVLERIGRGGKVATNLRYCRHMEETQDKMN